MGGRPLGGGSLGSQLGSLEGLSGLPGMPGGIPCSGRGCEPLTKDRLRAFDDHDSVIRSGCAGRAARRRDTSCGEERKKVDMKKKELA